MVEEPAQALPTLNAADPAKNNHWAARPAARDHSLVTKDDHLKFFELSRSEPKTDQF
jgi:hypothetical protein